MVKKAQMKIQQMAFMLIAVTLFFVMAGMLVLVFRFSGLREKATLLEQENAMLLVSKLANSPEFSCGEAFGNRRTNCIDADKVMMLKESISKYIGFWGVTNIEIRKIYPESYENTECEVGNYPDCSVIKIRSGETKGIGVANFVSLCRKELSQGNTYDKCELAKLIISYEEK